MSPWSARVLAGCVLALLLSPGAGRAGSVPAIDPVFDDGFECPRVYRDADGDGFGTATDSVVTCTPGPGYVFNRLDCNDANPSINPGAADAPDSGYLDSNCDGIDGNVSRSFFVSASGLDAAAGTWDAPFATISKGIATAASDAVRKNVLVAASTYDESLVLADGVNLHGQYQSGTWTRSPANATVIQGVASANDHDSTVIASGIAAPTTFEGFVVRGPFNDKPSGNSYAVYVSNASANLAIRNNVIQAGRGGPGAAGAGNVNGAPAVNGAGRDADPAAYDARTATGVGLCNVANNRAHANGGVRSCGTDDVSGGNGGGNRCRPVSTCVCASPGACTSCTFAEFSGIDGFGGQPGDPGGPAGSGGDAGEDMVLSGSTCFVPPTIPVDGTAGAAGANASTNGPAGGGCVATRGGVVDGHWVNAAAAAGINGSHGSGGGGGGAGGGARCQSCASTKDNLGAHGGGGGSGGCGGVGGAAGGGGGGVFGIFVAGGSAPVIAGNRITRGDGRSGGSGGNGGFGALGGAGGNGGISTVFCAGIAGRGGDGGAGGHGSGGGGGCGGSSFGIYTFGLGMPDYCTAGGNVIEGGSAGAGGSGGGSPGNSGGSGEAGKIEACSFN